MRIETAVKNLEKRGFVVSRFDTRETARDYLAAKFSGQQIGLGDSATLEAMGLADALSEHNTVWDYLTQGAPETSKEAMQTDIYITSANAVSETGEIINIDGSGNRVASTLFGRREVYFVVGTNKFADSYDAALWRARNIAAPKNAQRFGMKTPCAKKGDKCYDCSSPERICRGLVVLWGKMMGDVYMEVVIINEELGF